MRSRDKLKPLYLYYHSAYVHRTWWDGGLLWGARTHKVTWPFNHVLTRLYDKLKPLYLHHDSACGYPPWQDGDLPWGTSFIKLQALKSCGVARSRDKLKTFYLHYHNTMLVHQTWQCGNLRGSHPWSHTTHCSRGLARSLGKFEPLYLHYHSAYDYRTWQVGDLPWEAPINVVTWPFSHVILQDVTN